MRATMGAGGVVANVLLLVASVQAYSNPEACSGTCTNTHDPSVIRRSDGTYYRFSTGGEIATHTAPDITGPWTYQGSAIPGGSSIDLDGNTDLWAPDVHLVDDTYYMYYSVSTSGSQDSAIGVATSTELDVDTWTDHGATGISSSSSKVYNAIDANLIVVDDTNYLNFGSFWNDLNQVVLSSSLLEGGGSASYEISYDPVTTAEEGSYMFAYGDYYYLFYSLGDCCGYDTDMPAAGAEYKIMVCRSTSPTGDFVDEDGTDCLDGGGTIVLETHDDVYGPGGQGVYDDPTYGPILYYHYVDITIGYSDADKQFGWNYIDFSTGWPVV